MKSLCALCDYMTGLLDKQPGLGYFGAAVPTTTGFWVLIEDLTKLGAFASILIGITVGILTWRVQLKSARKLDEEHDKFVRDQSKG